MAENCEIGDFKNKMTRDHLGMGGRVQPSDFQSVRFNRVQ